MTSPIYRDPRLYRAVLRTLYGDALAARERIVARLVRPGSVVADVACGDAGIRRRLRGVRYVGLDVSPTFVRALQRSGVEAIQSDASRGDLPIVADYVLLLGSLYQFLPDADRILDRLARSARTAVVVAEPFRNLAQSANPVVAALARRATDPGVDAATARFDEASLRALFVRHRATEVHATSRELVASIPGRAR